MGKTTGELTLEDIFLSRKDRPQPITTLKEQDNERYSKIEERG